MIARCPSLALTAFLCAAVAFGDAAEARGRSSGSAHGSAKKHSSGGRGKKGKRGRNRPPAPPPMPSRIEVTSIEKGGTVRVELLGPVKPPEPRLFVLSDDRGRRFVPAIADCTSNDAPTAEKPEVPAENQPQVHWQCRLTLAPAYRRAVLTGVAMEWGDRVVSALPGQVRARWAEAPTAQPTPLPTQDKSEKVSPEATPTSPGSGEHDPEGTQGPTAEDDEENEDE